MRTYMFCFFLILLSNLLYSQYLPGEVDTVKIDSSWYAKLDMYQQQGLSDWIVNYNKAVGYYNADDFESANFYFEKVLRRSLKELFSKSFWTSATKNNLTVELNENIYLFRYIGYLKINTLPIKELERAFNKVRSHCPPALIRIAIEETKAFNAAQRKKKDRINYQQFLDN